MNGGMGCQGSFGQDGMFRGVFLFSTARMQAAFVSARAVPLKQAPMANEGPSLAIASSKRSLPALPPAVPGLVAGKSLDSPQKGDVVAEFRGNPDGGLQQTAWLGGRFG